jgi:hypothetical protein
MKNLSKFLILLILTILVGGCSSQSTSAPQNTATAESTLPEMTAYPVPDTYVDPNAYPFQAEQETPVPAYMVPGFITMTPDANLTSIIVSEVQHEEDVESIYIKNISSDNQDVSNYMIYSPKLDVRKILPNNLILEPGESFVLYNGADLGKFPEDQRWLDAPVLTEALDEVWLTNAAAAIIYYFTYYPSITP